MNLDFSVEKSVSDKILDELSKSAEESILGRSSISQPACTAIQVALTDLLESWNVQPSAVIGHSSGEIAAAYAAGILSLEDCMSISYYRGLVVGNLRTSFPKLKGAMLAIEGTENNIRNLLKDEEIGQADIACVNSPTSITVSGNEQAIEKLEVISKQKDIFNRRLRVDVAYHSHHMHLVENAYLSYLQGIKPRKSNIRFHSSLKGGIVEAVTLEPAYWVGNLTSTVRFSEALQSMCPPPGRGNDTESPIEILIEVGPHSALEGPVKQVLKGMKPTHTIQYAPTLVRKKDAWQTMMQLASTLFVKGCELNVASVNFPSHEDKRPFLLLDLPTYPWNHETRYWHESRVATNHRLKRFPRSDLIGAMTENCSDLEPVWRHVFRADDFPWLRHHALHSAILYPMAGFLCMALEAASQRAVLRETTFSQFVIHDFVISRPLIIDESTDVEMMITLRPFAEGAFSSSNIWDEFRIFSWEKDKNWSEHCRGLISLQNEPEVNPITGEIQRKIRKEELARMVSSISNACLASTNEEGLHQTVAGVGLEYGLSFKGLTDIRRSNRMTSYKLTMPYVTDIMPSNPASELILHPVPLDLCIQMMWPILDAALSGLNQLYLPSSVKSISISHDVSRCAGESLQLYGSSSKPVKEVPGPEKFSFVVLDPEDNSKTLISFDDLTASPVPNNASRSQKDDGRELCIKYRWEPVIDSLKSEPLQQMLGLDGGVSNAEKQRVQLLDIATYHFIEEALKEVMFNEVITHSDFASKMYRRMLSIKESTANDILAHSMPMLDNFRSLSKLRFREELLSLGIEGEVVQEIGSNLPRILCQAIGPSALTQEICDRYRHYKDSVSFNRSHARAAICIDKLAHQNPYLRILEIGSGCTAMTVAIVALLGGNSSKMTTRFRSYEYTHHSNEVLEKANVNLRDCVQSVKHRKLDITRDIVEQGFEPSSYDLIVASNSINTRGDLGVVTRNIRSLLKYGGKLLLIEQTIPTLRGFAFSTLRQWCQVDETSLEGRNNFCESDWNDLLHRTGFSGISVNFKDFNEAPEHCQSLMLASATSSEKLLESNVVIIRPESLLGFSVHVLASNLEKWMKKAPSIATIQQVDPRGKICIFLDELVQPFLANLDQEGFLALQKLVTLAEGILWVVRGSFIDSTSPNSNMVSGFARTIRSERAVTFVTLDLDGINLLSDREAALITNEVFQRSFDPNIVIQEIDTEYVERQGVLYIPRFVKDSEINHHVARETQSSRRETQFFAQEDRPLRMMVSEPGSLDSLVFVDDPIGPIPLGADEIEIEVMAVGLNFKDIMIALGQLPDENLGLECSGIVSRVGKDPSHFRVGDRVSAAAAGTFSTYARCPASSAHKMPDEMSFEVASTIPIVFCTAFYSLVELARLEEHETVLIHAAAGGVGQAAIMLAQKVGATIFATVGSVEKKELLMSVYNIPGEQIFFSRDLSFVDCIMTATNGKGVDVVLNSLAGNALQATWGCLAPFGRFIEIGKRDIVNHSRLQMAKFNDNALFASVDLTLVAAKKPRLMKRLMDHVFGEFQSGSLRPIAPITTYPISEVETAFRALQSGKAIGKIAVKPEVGDQVMVCDPDFFCASHISLSFHRWIAASPKRKEIDLHWRC